MSDTSGVTGGSPPPPTSRAEPPPSERGAPAQDPRTDAFRAALNAADRRDEGEDDADAQRGDDPQPGSRKRKGGEGGGLASLLGLKGAPHQAFGLAALRGTKDDGKEDALAGLGAWTGGAGAPGPDAAEAAQGASPADLSAFTEMMEAAAARAQAAGDGAAVSVTLNDAGALLQGFQVSRSADGALSFTLQAAPGAAEEVSRSLDTLRRKLEAKGLSLGEIRLAPGDGPGPQAVQAAEAG